MRTLTQVWLFFLALTFLFLILGFQIAGRLGLLIAFLFSLFLVYATLQRALVLFRKKLNAEEYLGNDPSGFLTELNKNKLHFKLKKIYVYRTSQPTPLLIWRNRPDEGHVVFHQQLIENLSPKEIRLLSLFTLAHLESRSFLLPPILSLINQSLLNLAPLSSVFSFTLTTLARSQKDVFKADEKFKLMSDASNLEIGYFINKLHHFEFAQSTSSIGTEYFSVLSVDNGPINRYGIPSLKHRLKKLMGFYL